MDGRDPAPGRRARVLAVDNEVDAASAIRDFVVMQGHECLVATSGGEALELCRQHHFDCMFLDARLGGVSGLSVAQRLGGVDSLLRPLHIIVLSVAPREDFQTPLRERVVDGYLQKPATRERIQKALARCLSAAPG